MKYWENKTDTPIFQLKKNNKNLYIPYPQQLYLHYANKFADEILYGGAAGGGKTYSMLYDAYIKCVKYPGINVAIFRRTFPELERTFIAKSKMYFDSSMGYYNEKTKTWTIYTKSIPSKIQFCHCKTEKDVFSYQSAEFDVIYIDELTHWTEFQYSYIITRLRSSRTNEMEMNPHIICATNPGGVGHGWVKKRWRLHNRDMYYKVFDPEEDDNSNGYFDFKIPNLTRLFIPAKVTDNYYIIQKDPKYISRLLTSQFSKQLLEGDWSIFAGQAFPEFSNKHIIQPFEIPSHWKRYVSIDYGYSKPFCALWHAQDPVSKKVYTYREVYKTKLNDAEQARLILELSEKEKIEAFISDPSVFSPRGSGSSIAQVWNSVGMTVVGGNNQRIAGWQRVHDWLILDSKEEPVWYIFDKKCPNLIRTLPEMVYSMSNPEDIDTDAEDHAVDALRYFFMHIDYPFFKKSEMIRDTNIYSRLDPVSKAEWDYVREKIFLRNENEKSIANELRGMDV